MRNVLNLYGGLGGNRRDWTDVHVTMVERDPKIADIYIKNFPDDTVIIGDAHEYLREYYNCYDFIWSSPPCQKNSKMEKCNSRNNKSYPDLRLYEEIIFLQHNSGKYTKWVVENVDPYYTPLIEPSKKCGRHLFWSNFYFTPIDIKSPKNFINKQNQAAKKELMDWLGIHYDKNIYYENNHDPTQVLRNCVHPSIGKHIFDFAIGALDSISSKQLALF